MPVRSERRFVPDDLFRIRKPVAPMARADENREDDIIKIETVLGHTGDLDPRPTGGPTGFYGVRQMEGIKRFQKRNGLTEDGIVKPGGPTIRALAARFGGSNITGFADTGSKPKRLIDKRQRQGKRLGDIRRIPETPRGYFRPSTDLPSPRMRKKINDTLIEAKRALDESNALPQDASSNEVSQKRKRFFEVMGALSDTVWDADFKSRDYMNKHHAYAAEMATKMGLELDVATEFGLTQRHLGQEAAVAGGAPKLVKDHKQSDVERAFRQGSRYKITPLR